MFTLKIVTPKGEYENLEVERVTLPTSDGVITMLSNHMPLLTPIEFGVMRVKGKDFQEKYAVSQGLFTFKDNEASLLVDTIENSDEIDFVRAAAAKERAEERISKKESSDEIKRGEMALKRSLVRLSLENK